MIQVTSQQARHGGRRKERDVLAAIVSACKAGLALEAGNVGLDGDAVAGLEGFHGWMDGEDDTCRFVAEDVVGCYLHWADASGVPEMDV
jgi:hypothetical protein